MAAAAAFATLTFPGLAQAQPVSVHLAPQRAGVFKAAKGGVVPHISSLAVTPAGRGCRKDQVGVSCPSSGGAVRITVRASGATRAVFSAQPEPFAVLRLVKSVAVRNGVARVTVAVGRNRYKSPMPLKVRVAVISPSGRSAVQTMTVTDDAPALPPAGGGGTPPQTTPAPPSTPTSPQSLPQPTVGMSSNWSGYAMVGGPFTAAQGTFTVPGLLPTQTEADTSEWIGVDGDTNSNLIQAGVDEQYTPATNQSQLTAWWEILPAPMTPIRMTVNPGDSVSVTLQQVNAGLWQISIVNNTNGQRFSIQRSYSGPGTSAEWIVEAPTLAATNAVETLAPFSPPVVFTNNHFVGAVTSLTQVLLSQNGQTVAYPSPMNSNADFSVGYGSSPPAAPAPTS